MRVLVCGGRDFNDAGMMYRVLDHLHAEMHFTSLIHGGAQGADFLAGTWAQSREPLIHTVVFKADWKTLGRRAGPARNEEMLGKGRPDIIVAFPGGRGTEHMTKIALAAHERVIEVFSDGTWAPRHS